MNLPFRLAPRVVALLVWTLTCTVAAGAATPRLRGAGRDRAARAGIARAGSLRLDDARAWVAPEVDRDPEYTAADRFVGHTARSAPADVDRGFLPWSIGPSDWPPAPPAAAALASPVAPDRRLERRIIRRGAGRAPPCA
jgi:hypothetical protein